MENQDSAFEQILKHLESIEHRLSRLESGSISAETKISKPEEAIVQPENPALNTAEISTPEESIIEYNIGSYGLAWLGNFVLFFGILFLTQYLISIGQQYTSVILGYTLAIVIFILAKYLKKVDDYLAFTFRLNAQIILFFISLRLHLFSTSPLIANHRIFLIILLLLVAFQTYLSIHNKSQAYGALAVLFTLTTAIIGDTTHIMLPLVVLASIGSVWFFVRYNWRTQLIITVFLTYMSFFFWLFGNPLVGNPFLLISEQHLGVIYLFGLGAVYSIVLLFRKKDASSDDFLIGLISINGLLFTSLLLLIVLRFYHEDYVLFFAILSICCLIFSALVHAKSNWNFGSAFYVLYGFMAMSISVYGLFGFPDAYLLLAVQSLLVVSMALWFRNRLIIVMNLLLFLSILFAYLLKSESVDTLNFIFVIISLLSARIINWMKYRLKIKTDLIRNIYLIIVFLMMLYSLSQALPKQFITLSWTLAALFYFALSILLKNVKYRYMALGTMICAAVYLFLVDLARMDITFRVLALMFLAVISIGISMYYISRIKKSRK